MFNVWRPYPLIKPNTEGWYSCTLSDGTVMDLYFIEWASKWMDQRRQRVFDGYQVYKSGRGLVPETRVYDDRLCDRTSEVTAWKRVSRGFGWWWKSKRG